MNEISVAIKELEVGTASESSNENPTFISGKAKPYPSEMEKVAQDEIKSKINEIEAALNDGDHALDEKMKTVKSTFELAKKSLTNQIQRTHVSFVIEKFLDAAISSKIH